MKALAKHFIAELYDCDREILNDVSAVEQALLKGADAAKATIVGHSFHHFSPHGVSGVVIIAESHISIHTWPEYGYAAVDIFTCGDLTDNDTAISMIRKELCAGRVMAMEMKRGFPDLPDELIRHKPEDAE